MLQTLDSLWKEHLAAMDYLRQGIHLRGYAQKDPKQEYKRESFAMFAAMLESLKYEVISTLSKVQVRMPEEVEAMEQQRREAERHSSSSSVTSMTTPQRPLHWRHRAVSEKWDVTIRAHAAQVKIQTVSRSSGLITKRSPRAPFSLAD